MTGIARLKVAIATLGCKVNQYESAGILEALERQGVDMVPFDQPADYYVINTCTVTSRADVESRRLIRRAARTNPQAQIIVTGCYARLAADDLKKIPGVALVTDQKALIPGAIAAAKTPAKIVLPYAPRSFPDLSSLKPVRFHGHTRAFLKIQDGCNSRCRYCIVPLARGPSRSIPETEVISRMDELRRAGFREIVLTGIHLGAYGTDLLPPTDLAGIVKTVMDRHAVERLRLSSIEPVEITDSLITIFEQSGILCRHLHIPLQSGDDGILRRMGRPYDSTFFAHLLEKIRQALPDMAVGLDVMVGFPGEDEQAFERTLHFIAALPVAYLHVFPYSERPGTEAAVMSGKVSDADKNDRAERMRNLGKRKRTAFVQRFIGQELAVLVEGKPDRKTGLWKGFSGNYIPVMLADGDVSLINRIVHVRAHECRDGKLYGRITDG
ncbi:MAG: tRNA (N(6)-L-threonylcarbamoyladenosine(37)-C(2))-methylthiotransferase MtaB [Syntrophus sp. (in: bacteria)]|nr:tRNA (N(6)-L-threonylcarbamoyladenosine(37)-C(2))-methylthiotransferase MtaB [Syntrophus sp. (in: bacteria)]